MENFEDPDITRAVEWVTSYLHEDHWPARMQAIEDSIQPDHTGMPEPGPLPQDMRTLKVKDDQIGWYIYLMRCLTCDTTKYEFYQGARIAPIFRRIGSDLDFTKRIGGIDVKIRKLLKREKNQADSNLFEILVATLWVKNGWTVNFIPEGPRRSADFKASRDGEEWLVECKRLSQRSAYSVKEQQKWLTMLNYISDYLLQYGLLMEITFHKELHTLSDTFLQELFAGNSVRKGDEIQISNSVVSLRINKIDIDSINKHLKNFFVKEGSPFLRELMGGKLESTGFTTGLLAQFGTFGQVAGYNRYITNIQLAYGVDWKCDAPEALYAKSRDIWQQLKDANGQFIGDQNAAIHIGLETLDGTEVELRRFEKIVTTASMFDRGTTGLKLIYCHFLQSYSLPEEIFVYDETGACFHAQGFMAFPLEGMFLVSPEDSVEKGIVHWRKPHP